MISTFDKKALTTLVRNEIKQNIDLRKFWLKQSRESIVLLAVIDALPDTLESPTRTSVEDNSIFFTYRYDKVLRQQITVLMENAGFKKVYEINEKDIDNLWQDPKVYFENKDLFPGKKVTFTFSDSDKDSTCKRVEIGKVVKEVPVFEWVCPDGQKEQTQA